MNSLPGVISEIISEGPLSLVRVKVAGHIFSSIVVDTPHTEPNLKNGHPINILFKENEVAIAKSFSGQISLQNKMDCIIESIEHGQLLGKVRMVYNQFFIVSLITEHAAIQLDLKVGDKVTAMVKTNEISLAYD